MSLPGVTQQLIDKVQAALAAGHEPLVVLDLDGTLYNNTPRTLRILQEFAHLHGRRLPDFLRVVDRLPAGSLKYRVADTLAAAGIKDEALVEEVERFWFERFFTNDYVLHDLPVAGAVEFVRALYERGAVPVYLTGRDAPNMLLGTVKALQRDGFPVGTVDTHVILKDKFERRDEEYKRSVVEHLRRVGAVVGVFDNEPGLCNLFQEAFPEATVVWLDTSHAPGAPALMSSVQVAMDFGQLVP